jgi:hypothetical protein
MQVSNAVVVGRGTGNRVNILIPKVLICSQVPADASYPLDISLRVLPPPDGQQGQWAARIYVIGRGGWGISLAASHPLSAYVGRRISKMSLSRDRQLTVTFAPAAAGGAQ